MKKVWKIAEKILIAILIIAVIASAVGMFQRVVLKEELPSVFGYKRAMVLSGSMEPTISVGDLVIYKEQSEYQIDDVVIFTQSGVFVTHRIVGITTEGYITQGDANNVADGEIIPFENVEGKMIYVLSGFGNVSSFFQTPKGLVCLLLIGFLIIEIPSWLEKRKKEDKEES